MGKLLLMAEHPWACLRFGTFSSEPLSIAWKVISPLVVNLCQ